MHDDRQRRSVALEAVRRACRLTRQVQRTLISDESRAAKTLSKQDRSPVTVADFGAQAVISIDLDRGLAGEAIMGEENAKILRTDEGAILRQRVLEAVEDVEPGLAPATVLDGIDRCAEEDGSSGSYWILDPIDGTKGFLRQGQYAVALAWTVDHELRLGLLGCPNLPLAGVGDGAPGAAGHGGSILVAEKGRGVMLYDLDGREIRAVSASEILDPSAARFCESVEAAHSAHGLHGRIAARLGVTTDPVRMDSQCKYAALGRGDASIYLRLLRSREYREKVWDHAAGALVVTEAGGRVTNVSGRNLDFSQGRTLPYSRGIIATNGHIHDRVVEAVGIELETEDTAP